MALAQQPVPRVIPPLDESPELLAVRGFDFVPAPVRAIGPTLEGLRTHGSEVVEHVMMDAALHGLEVAMTAYLVGRNGAELILSRLHISI